MLRDVAQTFGETRRGVRHRIVPPLRQHDPTQIRARKPGRMQPGIDLLDIRLLRRRGQWCRLRS
jgi:hypothetical protein